MVPLVLTATLSIGGCSVQDLSYLENGVRGGSSSTAAIGGAQSSGVGGTAAAGSGGMSSYTGKAGESAGTAGAFGGTETARSGGMSSYAGSAGMSTSSGGSDNPSGGSDNASGGSDNASAGTNNASAGSDNASGGTNNASGGTNNASGGTNNASAGTNNASGGVTGVQPDPDLPVLNCGATACSDSAMIADMESNDGQVCSINGRFGNVSYFGDGTGTQWPVGAATRFSPLETCRGISSVAVHVKGADFTAWGAGIAIHFSTAGFDATGFSGIRFWARSSTSTQISIGVVSLGTQDISYGGTCVPAGGKQCNDHFVTKRNLTPNWVAYPITFSELRQAGWGVPAATSTVDATAIVELNIVAPQGQPFDYWLDDITFNM